MRSNIIGFVTVEVYALLELCSNAAKHIIRATYHKEANMKPTDPSNNSKGLEGEYRIVSLFIDNAKTYIQLSTGALLLSVTFLQGLTGTKDIIPIDAFIIAPWVCWLLTILSGVTYQYCVVKYLEQLEEEHGEVIEPKVKEIRLLKVFCAAPVSLVVRQLRGTLYSKGS